MASKTTGVRLIAIHFARLGPYHTARLRSAAEMLGPLGWRVLALEMAGNDATYAWDRESGGAGWERETVFPDRVFERIPSADMRRGIECALNRWQPEAMAIAGWGTVDARACLGWCQKNGAQAIVMSETRAVDGRRVWWKEWVKSRIVRRFQAALCGGESHKRYLIGLGMPAGKIAFGYNVVDNGFYAAEPAAGVTTERGLAEPCFLASNRFVERKNLARLIRAYALYAARSPGGRGVWPLVLLGDGPLRAGLQALCGELGLAWENSEAKTGLRNGDCVMSRLPPDHTARVVFAGFRQIGELPAFYAKAGVFVHPALEEPWGLVLNEAMASGLPVLSSRNVGAAEELVREGQTGFLFDPENPGEIAACLGKMADMAPQCRFEMGLAARKMVEDKVPLRAFGAGLAKLLS